MSRPIVNKIMSTKSLLETMQRVHSHVAYARELGMQVLEASRESTLVLMPPNAAALSGDTVRGWLATGVTTALIDSACGVALHAHLGAPEQIATIDLRVDYLRPARADLALYCRAECFRLTRSIAFMRAAAYQDDPAAPVATASGGFMRLSAAAP